MLLHFFTQKAIIKNKKTLYKSKRDIKLGDINMTKVNGNGNGLTPEEIKARRESFNKIK